MRCRPRGAGACKEVRECGNGSRQGYGGRARGRGRESGGWWGGGVMGVPQGKSVCVLERGGWVGASGPMCVYVKRDGPGGRRLATGPACVRACEVGVKKGWGRAMRRERGRKRGLRAPVLRGRGWGEAGGSPASPPRAFLRALGYPSIVTSLPSRPNPPPLLSFPPPPLPPPPRLPPSPAAGPAPLPAPRPVSPHCLRPLRRRRAPPHSAHQ